MVSALMDHNVIHPNCLQKQNSAASIQIAKHLIIERPIKTRLSDFTLIVIATTKEESHQILPLRGQCDRPKAST